MKVIIAILSLFFASFAGYCQQDSVFSIVSGDSVTIWNTDIEANCAAEFGYSVVMLDSNIIVLTEMDTSGRFARCLCKFDIQYQLIDLGPGHYDVEVHRAFLEKYGYPKDTVIFIGSTSFDVDNIFMPPVMTSFKQSPCGGFVGVNPTGMVEYGNFLLSQNYPNPFNPSTIIHYQLPTENWVTLKVYDLLGREVATLVNEVKKTGNYEVIFDGCKLPSGLYFYQLRAGNFSQSKKLILLR